MPYIKRTRDYEYLMYTLRILKLFHDLGIYAAVTGGMNEVTEEDFYELADLGIENVAPIFRRDEVSMDEEENQMTEEALAQAEAQNQYYEGHYHTIYRFSSPEMKEYYRLCRLYEYREGLEPKDNPYVNEADGHFIKWARSVSGYLWIGYDCDFHTTELVTETCPEEGYDQIDLIMAIHRTLQFYKDNLGRLKREINRNPFIFLPALPALKEAS